MAEDAGELLVNIRTDIGKLKAGFNEAMQEIRAFGRSAETETDKVSSSFQKMGQNIADSKWIWAGISAGIAALGTAAVAAEMKMDKFSDQFEVLTGSARGSMEMMANLTNFVRGTPFEVTGVMQAAQQLYTFGLKTKDIIPTLTQLGNVAAGLGKPIEAISFAFGRVAMNGQLTTRELRTFTSEGVPIVDMLSKALGKSADQIVDLAQKGKISFAQVQLAFKMAGEAGGAFHDQMKIQGKDTESLLTQIKNNVILLADSFGKILLPYVQAILGWFVQLTDAFRALDPETKKLIIAGAALVGIIAGLMTALAGVVAFWGTITAVAAVAFSWVGAVVLAVGTVIAVIAALVTNAFGMRDAFLSIWNAVKSLASSVLELFLSLNPILQAFFGLYLTIWDTIIQTIWGMRGEAGGFFTWLWGIVTMVFGKIIDAIGMLLPQTVKDAFNKVKADAITTGATISDEFSKAKDKVGAAINDVKTKFSAAGVEAKKTSADTAAAIGADADGLQTKHNKNQMTRERAWQEENKGRIQLAQKTYDFLGMAEDNWTQKAKQLSGQMFQQFGYGVADMIQKGRSFADVMKNLWQDMTRQIIAYIAQMIVKWLVFQAITGGQGGAFASVMGPFSMAADGAVIREPSVVTGLRSGKQTIMGEAGPEAIVPANTIQQGAERIASAGTEDNGGGGNLTVNVNISGQFIEADSATWQSLIRDKIVPEIRRFTMSTPVGPFTRRRGAVA